ncbi:MAG TPA: membrane protein insertase YidC [Terriglobales bacterium]|nr:membrane protein insertase YidC [Terriglobales bacterium]
MAEFPNPQQDPGMERRLLLVFALTFLVIILFQPLLKKYLPQPATPPAQTQAPAAQPTQPAQPVPPQQAQASPPVATASSKQAASETQTVIENDLYRVTFSNRGAEVKSWILKKYDDDHGKPLDLVSKAAEKFGYPLSLWTYDETQRNKLNSALYVASESGNLSAPATVTFEYADQDVAVRKTFSFDHSYVIHTEVSVVAKGSQVTAFPMWPAGFGDQQSPASYAASRIEHQYNDKTERLDIKKISGGATVPGPFNWAGVVDQYFAAVFLPDDPQSAAAVSLRNPVDIPKDWRNPNPQETIKADVLGVAVGNLRGATEDRLYVGPKSLGVLESISVPTVIGAPQDLRSLVNFGFFGVIARPLFLWLKWTYEKVIHNWGWAIAIQTLIINLALLPLRISSMKSALKMQKVAPQIKAIQEKYKKYSMRDPRKQEMNQEVSALYKAEGVNPVGGCLPMVIQMPFLFAYYSMLGAALDLRHASWLWIHDLSSPDPWHLLPIGIIITMLLTQRMTPQPGMDPSQQKMMTFMMPLMLGVISWNLAAGLCLYWSEGNLIAIAQQAVMNRTSLGREMREIALKRARKKEK